MEDFLFNQNIFYRGGVVTQVSTFSTQKGKVVEGGGGIKTSK